MKHEHINYFAVGLFVLTMITIFVIVIALITGRGGDTDDYTVYYDNIAGLKYGTTVSYEGYQIGQVDDIQPIQTKGATRYKVYFSIRKGWKVPKDSIAKMVSSGLLSDVAINIEEGASNDYLKPGDTINGQEGSNVFASMNSAANDIKLLIADMRKITAVLTDQNGMTDIMNNIKQLTTKLNESADRVQTILSQKNQQRIEDFLTQMNSVSSDLTNVTSGINTTLNSIDKLVGSTNNLLEDNRRDIRKSIQNLNTSLQIVADNINSITYNMDITSRNMSEFTRQIRENPGLLLGSQPPKDQVK